MRTSRKYRKIAPRWGETPPVSVVTRAGIRGSISVITGEGGFIFYDDPPTSDAKQAAVTRAGPTDVHSVATFGLAFIRERACQVPDPPAAGAGFGRDIEARAV